MGLIADIVEITEITQKRAAELTKENKTFREILNEELKKFEKKNKEKAKELCKATEA